MKIIAYGGGTNSTALIILCQQKKIEIDVIIFADTGGEKPHTYEFIRLFNKWLVKNGMPSITIVKAPISLEQRCKNDHCLPSKAYGNSSCSHRFKIQPANKWVNNFPPAKSVWQNGEKITKYIGIDAGEAHRASISEDGKYDYKYPLVDWDMDRDDCIKTIEETGLPLPGKSACFFCPSSKISEIRLLQKQYPNLMQRAIEMERRAKPYFTSINMKGLGRNYSWENVLDQNEMFEDNYSKHYIEICSSCYDG